MERFNNIDLKLEDYNSEDRLLLMDKNSSQKLDEESNY